MNREIKFQTIHKEYGTGKVFIGGEWGPIKGGFQGPSSYSNTAQIGHREYIGIRDINGFDVYEGDILKNPLATEPEDLGWTVIWHNRGFAVRLNRTINNAFLILPVSDDFMECEVIGNIYTNPNLLS